MPRAFYIYTSKEVEIASQLIKLEKYYKLSVPENICRIDCIMHDTVFMEDANYTLGTQHDGHFSKYTNEFTWFAFRKTEKLASQIEEKLNRYIFSDEMTQLIKAINQAIKLNLKK